MPKTPPTRFKRIAVLFAIFLIVGAFVLRVLDTVLTDGLEVRTEVLRMVLPDANSYKHLSDNSWEGLAEDGKTRVGFVYLATSAGLPTGKGATGLLLGIDVYGYIHKSLYLNSGGQILQPGIDPLKEALPGCSDYVFKQRRPLLINGYITASNGEPTLHGYAFLSREASPRASGYSGPISFLIGMTVDGSIAGLCLLEHNETSGYADGIGNASWFGRLVGLNASDQFRLGKELDGIARATISSQAVLDTIRESIQNQSRALNIEFTGSENKGPEFLTLRNLATVLWVIITFILLLLSLRAGSGSVLRYIALTGACIFIGLFTLSYITVVHIGSFVMFQPPPLLGALGFYIVMAFALFTSLIWGRAYCGFLCPLGAVLELASRLSPRKARITATTDRMLKMVKYIVLTFTLAMAIYTANAAIMNYEPFDTVFLMEGSIYAVILSIAVIVLAIPFGRFFCRYLCGVGGCLGLVSKHAFNKLILTRNCNRCGDCIDGCPMGAISLGHHGAEVDSAECIRCGDCLRICPNRHQTRRSVWGIDGN